MVSMSRSSRLISTFVKNRFYKVFQKLKFSSRIKVRMEIMPQAYKQYVENRIFMRNAKPGQKDIFSYIVGRLMHPSTNPSQFLRPRFRGPRLYKHAQQIVNDFNKFFKQIDPLQYRSLHLGIG